MQTYHRDKIMSVIATAPPGYMELHYVTLVFHAGTLPPALQHTAHTNYQSRG